jgi:uncharacterized membrane protein
MAERTQRRIAYVDWMRGFACLLMFQVHGYDAWLNEPSRHTQLWAFSQLGGTVPAPIFLVMAGFSVALVGDRMRHRGATPAEVARFTMRRGAEVFVWGLLFRAQEYVLGLPGAPWTDLLRVDVLNAIGVSIMLLSAVSWIASLGLGTSDDQFEKRLRVRTAILAVAAGAITALAAPPLWTTHRPRWLPWFLEAYINGVHIYDKPQPYLFPIFPWAAFAFGGLAAGIFLLSAWARRDEFSALACIGGAGVLLGGLGLWLDARPQFYAVYDFWHSSPNFLLIRFGIVLALIFFSYAWCRWGLGRLRFNPLIEMGKTSLVVYWVHIEFVYGRFSILRKGAQSIFSATLGILVVFAAMTALAVVRNRLRGSGLGPLAFWRRPVRAAA